MTSSNIIRIYNCIALLFACAAFTTIVFSWVSTSDKPVSFEEYVKLLETNPGRVSLITESCGDIYAITDRQSVAKVDIEKIVHIICSDGRYKWSTKCNCYVLVSNHQDERFAALLRQSIPERVVQQLSTTEQFPVALNFNSEKMVKTRNYTRDQRIAYIRKEMMPSGAAISFIADKTCSDPLSH